MRRIFQRVCGHPGRVVLNSDTAQGSGSVLNKKMFRSINLESHHCNRFFYFEIHGVISSADILKFGNIVLAPFVSETGSCLICFTMGGKGRNWSGFVLPWGGRVERGVGGDPREQEGCSMSGCFKGQVHQLIDYCVSCFYLIRVVGNTAVQPAAFGRLD